MFDNPLLLSIAVGFFALSFIYPFINLYIKKRKLLNEKRKKEKEKLDKQNANSDNHHKKEKKIRVKARRIDSKQNESN